MSHPNIFCHKQPRMEDLDRQMSQRGDEIRHLKDKMNRVEDEVFADFCEMIGVPNIRYICSIIIYVPFFNKYI